ncbi:MAG: DNA-binding protein [Nanoarchaeota archaeon]|nr:DNA-binding protein [Nanoarchaeota archaeon]
MKIQDIKPNQGKISIEAIIVEIDSPRDINSAAGSLKVANAIIQDDSGKMKLTLWNAEIDKVKVGDKIRITNGFAKEYRDEIQLSAGKFGKLEVIGQEDISKLPAPKQEVEGKVEAMDDSLYEEDDEW